MFVQDLTILTNYTFAHREHNKPCVGSYAHEEWQSLVLIKLFNNAHCKRT